MKTVTSLSGRKAKGRIFLLLSLCACLSASVACTAQNTSVALPDLPSHETGFSMGIYPEIGMWDPSRSGDKWLGHQERYKTDIGDTIDSWLIGAFTFHYYYNISRLHAVGLQTTVAFRHITTLPTDNPYQEPYSPLIKTLKRKNQPYSSLNAFCALQASYRITFKRYPVCSLYSGVSLGFTLYFMDEQWKNDLVIFPSGHLTVLGISLGKRNNGNIELGYGTQGVLKMGYSLRF